MESAVLQQLLALHPVQLTLAELAREVTDDPEQFAQRDAVERAVRELASAGLVHRGRDFVVPTRAALRCDELLSL
jgi:predicted transcriptional regulator